MLPPWIFGVVVGVFVVFLIWKAWAGRGGRRRDIDVGFRPFHLAIPVHDLAQARKFYGSVLGCAEGRSAERWVDFDFYGHQLSTHLADESAPTATNEVDSDQVPARHFGLILSWEGWQELRAQLEKKGTSFLIAPKVRFEGQPGEQATFFLQDPSGNALEFKAFRDDDQIYATS